VAHHNYRALGTRPARPRRRWRPETPRLTPDRSALSSPTANSATAVAEHLATGYIDLSCAAITAEQLVAADPTYQGTGG
jgi:hypothetical protein